MGVIISKIEVEGEVTSLAPFYGVYDKAPKPFQLFTFTTADGRSLGKCKAWNGNIELVNALAGTHVHATFNENETPYGIEWHLVSVREIAKPCKPHPPAWRKAFNRRTVDAKTAATMLGCSYRTLLNRVRFEYNLTPLDVRKGHRAYFFLEEDVKRVIEVMKNEKGGKKCYSS